MRLASGERVPHGDSPLVVAAGQLVLVVGVPGDAGDLGGAGHLRDGVVHVHYVCHHLLVIVHLSTRVSEINARITT